MEARFMEDTLSKLLQMGTVAEYQNDFEMLIKRVTGIYEFLLKSFYISVLKPTLQIELLRARPPTLVEALSLAQITSNNDSWDQASEVEMKVLVDGKQDDTKVVNVVVWPLSKTMTSQMCWKAQEGGKVITRKKVTSGLNSNTSKVNSSNASDFGKNVTNVNSSYVYDVGKNVKNLAGSMNMDTSSVPNDGDGVEIGSNVGMGEYHSLLDAYGSVGPSFLAEKLHDIEKHMFEGKFVLLGDDGKPMKLTRKDPSSQEEVWSFFEKQKVSRPNFVDWYRQLCLVLSTKDKENYLEHHIPAAPVALPGQQVPLEALAAHGAWVKGQKEVDTVNELHAMLKLHEETLPKKDANLALHAIRAGRVQKNQKNKPHKAAKGGHGKGKGKMGYAPNNAPFAPKPKTPTPPKKYNPAKDGLRGSKKLKPSALSLYVGDGHRAAVEAIGTYHLELPSGLVIILNNCHYAPSITRCVISVSHLFDDGFINRFDDNNVILVSKNNLVYFMVVPRDGIFEIDMSCSNTNDSSMYVITNKRAKINLDSSLLWHCHRRHISKKRIEKLQHDGLLNAIDNESLRKCVSCMSGKMARKPYSHQVERAKDLLGLIHTDVCGPFKIISRQGASYFVTFTDDFSRYGYVYLLKHKHEGFETFKVFQKEVENQLEKTIKSLRSNRGGEYRSQDFLDHLKEHGIITHRTLPYMPQNNGVSERRNRTLLDMVRSMMSQTTLSKSFWDYALETVACILNMVPTKKVDKTPYEIWHGQAPKLSYLKVWDCEEFVKRDTLTKLDKLVPRSFKCIFIRYPKKKMGYSFYSLSENKVFIAWNAEFFDSKL
nr:hypothetical protein [Tanacetum cinerariifolium]